MSEPTPGPYQTGRTDMQSYTMGGIPFVNIYREAEDSRTRIHLGDHLPLVIAKCNGRDIPISELWANARLLAASWEMYDFLQRIVTVPETPDITKAAINRLLAKIRG